MAKSKRAGHWPVVEPLFSACLRFALAASVIFAPGLLSGLVASAGDNPGELKAFAGKYPFDRVEGRRLLQMPGLRSRLQTLVGSNGIDDISRLNTVFRIEEHSGWLIAGGCRPHNCTSEQWTVAVNLDYRVLVCLGIEGRPVKFAATGNELVERPRSETPPCPSGSESLAGFQKAFSVSF